MTYEVKRGYSKREGCYMYGIYKDGELYDKCVLFGRENAKLVAELFTLMDASILDHDNGMLQIMQIRRIDKERGKHGKVENRV